LNRELSRVFIARSFLLERLLNRALQTGKGERQEIHAIGRELFLERALLSAACPVLPQSWIKDEAAD
jgi:hypothetical protein